MTSEAKLACLKRIRIEIKRLKWSAGKVETVLLSMGYSKILSHVGYQDLRDFERFVKQQ